MHLATRGSFNELWLSEADEKPLILSRNMLSSLLSKIASADKDKPLLFLSPSGIAGADIKEMCDMTKEQAYDLSKLGTRLVEGILTFPSIVIFAAHRCLLGGGLELSLAADFRFATVNCKYGLPEVGLGIIPGFGGIQLARLRSAGGKPELFLTGDVFIPSEIDLGIFTHVDEDWTHLLASVTKLISKLERASSKALIQAKKELLMDFKLDREGVAKSFSELFEQYDQRERMAAFFEERDH